MVATALQTVAALFLLTGDPGPDRMWKDSTGVYSTQAALVSLEGDRALLRKTSGALIEVPLERLSAGDQQYVRSLSAPGVRTFILTDGMKVSGRVMDYAQKKITIQRQYGKILVDGAPYEQLSTAQLNMVRRLIEHQYKIRINSLAEFRDWVVQQRGTVRELDFNGVLMSMAGGQTLPVPFFLFSSADQEALLTSVERQLALDNMMTGPGSRSAATYPAPTKPPVETGVDLAYQWRVALRPREGTRGLRPMVVLAAGRTSSEAVAQALATHPGYDVAAVAAMQPSLDFGSAGGGPFIPLFPFRSISRGVSIGGMTHGFRR